MVGASLDTPARDVAGTLGIRGDRADVRPTAPAGVFALDGVPPICAARRRPCHRTPSRSCCTRRERRRGRSSCRSHTGSSPRRARNVARRSALTPADRCLNVMPLFHIHGLVAALLASLDAGALGRVHARASTSSGSSTGSTSSTRRGTRPSRPCTRPCSARARDHGRRSPATGCGSSGRRRRRCPRRCSKGSSRRFGVPVIEAYGMTEAAHQMASNPLPPGVAEARDRRARPPARRSPILDAGRARPRRRRDRRGRDPRRERLPGLRGEPRGERGRLLERLVPDRRRGIPRRRRLPHPARPAQGDHQPGRREDLADGGRRRPPPPRRPWRRR